MTYARFLLVFLVVPIVLLALRLRSRLRPRHGRAALAVCLIALVYTAPWDNQAARTRLWTFDPRFAPPGHFVLFLPWEEYAFYILQSLLICLLLVALSHRGRGAEDAGL